MPRPKPRNTKPYFPNLDQIKVSITLPNGETGAVAYEPTRGLGHCEGQFAGIIPGPSVSCAELQQNDIVIIGTDGLWNALGGRRQNGDTGPPSEDIAGPLMATLRNFCAKHRQQDAQQLAVELTGRHFYSTMDHAHHRV
jgi:hypothetical protein